MDNQHCYHAPSGGRVKWLSVFLFSILIPAASVLAAPSGFNVQGRLTDSSGVNRNGTFAIRFGIWDQQPATVGCQPGQSGCGNLLWKRTYPSVSVTNGNFQITLADPADLDSPSFGSPPQPLTLPQVFSTDSRFLEITVVAGPGIPPGGEAPMVPRQQLVSVPYALQSASLQSPTTINSVSYAWPAAQGMANTVLTNDGAGHLGWGTVAGVPAGTIVAFAGSTPPSGWFECNGVAVSRSGYSALFAAIGTAWGPGDGSSTFNLPDLRGYFLRGWDHGSGIDPEASSRGAIKNGAASGNNVGSYQSDELQSHVHATTLGNSGGAAYAPGGWGNPVNNFVFGQTIQTLGPVTGNNGPETRPKNAYVMYIVKY